LAQAFLVVLAFAICSHFLFHTMAAGNDNTAQIQQMIEFIKNEANEKASEIAAKGEEEASIDRNKILMAGKDKVREDIRKKTKQLETKNAIAKSTAINKHRLDTIKSRQAALMKIQDGAAEKLRADSSGGDFLTKLILQGMLMLLEDQVQVRCRADDDGTIQGCFADAQDQYAAIISEKSGAEKSCTLTLDESNKLPADKLGGVVLSCQKDSITIDNTVDSRLALVMEQAKPKIRQLLFSRK